MGFAVPVPVARTAVRSYRTISPLPAVRIQDELLSAVYFLLHFP